MASPLKLLREAGLSGHNLIMFALVTAAFNGIVTASIGAWLAQSYASHQSRRHYVQTISDLIYERHTRARMVLSAIRRGADLDEVRHRKQAYDEVFVEWNKKVQNNVLPIREAMGAGDTSDLETVMSQLLVPAMFELDVCLTKSYDLRLSNQDFAAVLENCQRRELSEFILNCGSGLTDELFRLTRLTLLPTGSRDLKGARERAVAACTRPSPAAVVQPGSGPAKGN